MGITLAGNAPGLAYLIYGLAPACPVIPFLGGNALHVAPPLFGPVGPFPVGPAGITLLFAILAGSPVGASIFLRWIVAKGAGGFQASNGVELHRHALISRPAGRLSRERDRPGPVTTIAAGTKDSMREDTSRRVGNFLGISSTIGSTRPCPRDHFGAARSRRALAGFRDRGYARPPSRLPRVRSPGVTHPCSDSA